jgi:uncharacterized lipoprotein YmbA
MTRSVFHPVVGAFAALALAACGSAPPPRLYTLDASVPAAAGDARAAMSVYIGSVAVPEAVDRPQLVVRTGANEVAALDGHRWAEPLKVAIGRVVAAKLARDLGTPRVGAYPGAAFADAGYQVRIEIQRFDSAPKEVAIEAAWSVRAAANASASGRTVAAEPVTGGYDTIAAAHARALEALAADIAAAIRRLEAGAG